MHASRLKAASYFIFIFVVCSFVVAAGNMGIPLVNELTSPPMLTRGPAYGVVQLPKPTYTLTPLIETAIQNTVAPINEAATATVEMPSIIESTATIESLVQAEVVSADGDSSSVLNEQAASPAEGYSGNKRILVDISEQHMYVYEGDSLVFSFVSSTGMNNATRVGSFSVLDKIPNAYGATWDLWMPNWLGIYWAGSLENGIHALPILSSGTQLWAGYLGTPISFGCVVLGVDEAQLLYDWADVGTPVDIQW